MSYMGFDKNEVSRLIWKGIACLLCKYIYYFICDKDNRMDSKYRFRGPANDVDVMRLSRMYSETLIGGMHAT